MAVDDGNLYRVVADKPDPCHGYLGRSRVDALEVYWTVRTFYGAKACVEFLPVGAAFSGDENWQRMLPK